jgi:hypothetical protein
MRYRDYTVTLDAENGSWRVIDARSGAFLVRRQSQHAACVWIDRYEAYLSARAHAPGRTGNVIPWRKPRAI